MWKLHEFIETNKQRKKIEINMLPSIWTKCMELSLPLDEKSNKEEKERKKKKYMCKVINLNKIYNNCNTERNYNRRQTCWHIVLK